MTKRVKVLIISLIILLAFMTAFLVYIFTGNGAWLIQTSYLQSTEEIYIMEAGILYNEQMFRSGDDYDLEYDFDNAEYPKLLEKYGVDKTAGDGTEFEKALALMDAYAERLHHASDYDNHIDMNAISLLEFSLDQKSHGINCRAKSQILNEMCLSLGIFSRKVWIMPNSIYDNDCHVVNEIWDTKLNKWIMLDITNNFYWVDENGKPLSILEIRDKVANRKFCTPVAPNDNLENLGNSLNHNYDNFLYISKNMAYTYYCTEYTVGETDDLYFLIPEALTPSSTATLISTESIEKSPIQ